MSFYRLVFTTPTGEEKVLNYDPHTSTIIEDDTGLSFIERPVPKTYYPKHRVHPTMPGSKKSTPVVVKVQLGLQCNYSCSYCLQGAHVASAAKTNMADAKIFIKNLHQWLEGEPEKFEFWGGEPLVYFEKIKYLARELRAVYPKAKFLIISNGSLVDQEFIDFVNEYDVMVGISHDGPGQHLRGPDPFDDPEIAKWLLKLHAERKISFNAVITTANYDVLKIIEYFHKRVGPDANINFEGIVINYDNTGGEAVFTDEQYAVLHESLFAGIISKGFSSCNIKMMDFVKSLQWKRPSWALGQKCGMDQDDRIAVDLLGNVMTCQNTGSTKNHRIGSVFNLNNVQLDTAYHWSFREECSGCPVLQICKGACMYLPNDFKWYHSCNNEYHYNTTIMAGAFFFMTGGWILNRIEGDILRPDPKLLELNEPIASDLKPMPPVPMGDIWVVEPSGKTDEFHIARVFTYVDALNQGGDWSVPANQILGAEDPWVRETVAKKGRVENAIKIVDGFYHLNREALPELSYENRNLQS